MKKILLCAIAIILVAAQAFAVDPRLEAMGGIGIGVAGSDMQSYRNPAAVFFDSNTFTFAVHGAFEDTIKGGYPWPYLPRQSLDALFVAEMITMSLDVAYYADNYNITNGHVDLYQAASLNVNFSIGYKFISGGIGISGGSRQQRLDVHLESIVDLPVQTVLAVYDRVVNSEYIQVSAGVMGKVGNLYIGLLMANILGKDGSTTTFNWDTLFSQTGIGAYWSRDEYSSRGKMNNFVYSAGIEFDYLFTDNRSMNVGAEVKFRMVRDSSVMARVGYSAKLADMGQGTITAGLGAAFRKIELALNGEFPLGGSPRIGAVATLLF